MIGKRLKNFIKIAVIFVFLFSLFAVLPFVLYLKVLPWAVAQPYVINYAENIISKAFSVNINIEKPWIKTSVSPEISFGVEKFNITDKNYELLSVSDINIELSLKDLLKKKVIVLHNASLDNIFIDVNKVMDLPAFKQQKNPQKSDYTFDIFNSDFGVKNAKIIYNIDKLTTINLDIKDFYIDTKDSKNKTVSYSINTDIIKNKNILNIKTQDNNNIFIKDNKIIIHKSKLQLTQNSSKPNILNIKGYLDNKYNYALNLTSSNFNINEVISFLNSGLIENNITEQLVYFKNLHGYFDFDINADTKNIEGKIKLKKLSFNFEPLSNLPIQFTQGNICFNNKKITLKDFKGYYNNKFSNKMDFSGTVKDYMKSVDTDILGNAVVTNDFATNYMSKILNYPIKIKGDAQTRLTLKSKYNKMDIKWMFWFKRGNGFVVDGEESYMNDAASRVLSAKMHFENMLLNIKSMDYYAGNASDDMKQVKIPIISINGIIDFSNNQTYIKRLGLELTKPMPSGFINMLAKQKIFKGGTFTGHLDILNKKGYPPKIKADMKAEKVAIPSQRLFIKQGEFKTDKDYMHIIANGRFRRSPYELSGKIVNEIKFPIIVKNITLSVDEIDVEKYLKMFNLQQPTEAASDVNTAIAQSIEKSQNADVDDDIDEQTFNLANLIIEECILNVKKGFYKGINFANVIANLTLDKNSLLQISSNKFEIAEGHSSAKIDCDLKEHKYAIRLGIKEVNSDIIATNLLNLSKEIDGKASGLIELNTDDSLKLNGSIKFKVDNGVIGKVGLVEYLMKVAALFRNPLTMISPSVISDLINIPEGRFDKISGELILKDNVVMPMKIKSSAPQLSSYIVGTYNLENQDAALRIYTKFSNRKKGLYGMFRNISLNSLANRIPLSSRNDSNYYASEISQIPKIEADEKDCQIFLTKVDGDIEHNNFISSLKKIK